MTLTFYCYPNCSTCKKAEKYLTDKGYALNIINIKTTPPTKEQLKDYYNQSKLPLKRFFNTSGNSYKALNLKETFDNYSEEELLELLSKDGMLIKRPLIISDDFVLVGFREKEVMEKL